RCSLVFSIIAAMKNVAALQTEIELLREQLAAEQEQNILNKAQLKLEKEKRAEREAQIAVLHEQIKQLLKKRFGPSSEKVSADQLGLFNEAEETVVNDQVIESETTVVKSHTRARKPRVSIPENFPREEIIHDIAES